METAEKEKTKKTETHSFVMSVLEYWMQLRVYIYKYSLGVRFLWNASQLFFLWMPKFTNKTDPKNKSLLQNLVSVWIDPHSIQTSAHAHYTHFNELRWNHFNVNTIIFASHSKHSKLLMVWKFFRFYVSVLVCFFSIDLPPSHHHRYSFNNQIESTTYILLIAEVCII